MGHFTSSLLDFAHISRICLPRRQGRLVTSTSRPTSYLEASFAAISMEFSIENEEVALVSRSLLLLVPELLVVFA